MKTTIVLWGFFGYLAYAVISGPSPEQRAENVAREAAFKAKLKAEEAYCKDNGWVRHASECARFFYYKD